ncbi:MAG TPA: hypothetical protein VJ953_05660 [Saprospiraceae bacterium]|nr:hypothetical protein [Saprospiraceae bacterium]
MKTTTDKLFRLIKAMTPAEKRYFKRHYGSDTNTLTHLFDAINLQKEYDEADIRAQMPGKAANHLKVYKFQLEQLILKSLMSHQHFSSQEDKIRSGIAHFDILVEKGLLDMAQKQLERIKSITLKSDYLAYLPVIKEKEAKLHYLLTEGFSAASINPFYGSQQAMEELLAYHKTLGRLYSLVNTYLEKQKPLSKPQLQKELNGFSSFRLVLPENSKIALLNRLARGIELAILGEHQAVIEQLEEPLTELRKRKYAPQFPEIYEFGLRCMIETSFAIQDWSNFSKYLNEGLQFIKKQPELTKSYFYFAAYDIQYHLLTDQEASDLQKAIKKHQKQIDTLVCSPSLPQTIYFSWLSIAGMVHQWYALAEKHIDRLFQLPQEAVSFAPALGQILYLMLQFEKPNFAALNKFYREVKIKYSLSLPRQEKRLYSACLQFFGALSQQPKNAPELAENLLEEINAQKQSPFHRVFRQLFLHKWLRAIVKEESFIAQLEYN